MKLHERINRLLDKSSVFLIATIDQRGFPTVITVSQPLWREGLAKMQFYLDGNGETVQNILRDPTGSVCCYQELEHESLSLKGKFTVEKIESLTEVAPNLSEYQKELHHENPVIINFEAWTAKIHMEKQTQEIIV